MYFMYGVKALVVQSEYSSECSERVRGMGDSIIGIGRALEVSAG
jgi:hypothetical protein